MLMRIGSLLFFIVLVLMPAVVSAEPFVLQSERVFTPDEKARVLVYQRGSHIYEMCVWRIRRPLEFFLMQKDIARPEIDGTTIREQLDAAMEESKLEKPELFKKGVSVKENLFEFLGVQKLTVKSEGKKPIEVELQLPGVGVYLVELREGVVTAFCIVSVSEMVMVQKRTEDKTLVFVARRADGSPISDVAVSVYSGKTKVAEGKTANNGIASLDVEYRPSLRIFGVKGDDITLNESLFYPVAVESIKCYLYTDRPVYRPGEKVFFKGIVRLAKSGAYALPPQTKVNYRIVDEWNRRVGEGELELNRFGTFSGEFEIPEAIRLGKYTLIATVGTRSFQSLFFIEKYRKPEFRVSVKSEKPHYVQGEKIGFCVSAEYLFGAPVANAKLSYRILRSRFRTNLFAMEEANLYLTPQEFEFFKEEVVKRGDGTTDEKGNFRVEFEPERVPFDCVYRISVTVRDATGAFVYGSTSVKATVSELAIGIHTDKSLYKLEDVMKVSVRVFAYRGTAKGVEVRLTGSYSDGTGIGEQRAKTDARGMVIFTLPVMKRGILTLSASVKDTSGGTVLASKNVWVMEGVADVGFSGEWIEIVTDRSIYSVGEEAFVLVVAPAKPTYRLITKEADRLLDYSIVEAKGNAQVLKFKITKEMSPNFYLSVVLVHNNSVLTAEKMILVPPEHKRLRIKTSFNKERYIPRETAKVEIEVTDVDGRPVEAELSAGLVDEALYLVRNETTPNILKFFYPIRRNGVGTTTSAELPSVSAAHRSEWLMRLHGRMVKELKKLWEAKKGRGGLAAPAAAPMEEAENEDTEGLGYEATPALRSQRDIFKSPRIDREAVVEKPIIVLDDEKEITVSYGAAKEVYKEAKVRKEFLTTPFWAAHIVTDEDGRATLTLKLPDNLTEWRLTIRAVTGETLVSEKRAKTETRKDVLARVACPRFLRIGDFVELGMLAHNRSPKDLVMKLEFSAEGLSGRRLTATRRVKAGGSASLFADYKAEKTGDAKLVAKALSELESDAVELRLPVLPRGIRKSIVTAGVIKEGEKEAKVHLPDDVDIWTARLKVYLNPTVHSVVAEALKYLVAYPYGCVEQTMSRFMPALVAQKAFERFGVKMPSVSAKLPSVIEKGLKRLYSFQHGDGGWGWWENDATNPAMTAYVMLGLARARKVDVKVDEKVFKRGVAALKKILRERTLDYTTEAFCIFALSEAFGTMFSEPHEDVVRLVDKVFDSKRRSEANAYTKALVALALKNIKRNEDALVVAEEIEKEAKKEGTLCYWGRSRAARWSFDPVETTAFCLMALCKVKSESELIGSALNYLLTERSGTHWKSTRDTAASVLALTEFANSGSAEKKRVTLTVSVNGKEVHTFKDADPFDVEAFLVDVGPDLLRLGENSVRIDLAGGGPLNYLVLLSYQSAERRIRASDGGFKVSRKFSVLRPVVGKDKQGYERAHQFVRDGIVKQGDMILVEVCVECDKEHEYFILTDHLAAGFEVDKEAEAVVFKRPPPKDIHREIHDEKVLFFVPTLKKGKHTFRYIVRPTLRGVFAAMPAVAELMYFPDVRGNSDETVIEVR